MKYLVKFILIIVLLSGCRAVVERPANPEIVIIPASPGPGFIYVSDSWRWNRHAHSYRVSKGHWVKPGRSSARWVDGQWIQTRSGWKYARGHWR